MLTLDDETRGAIARAIIAGVEPHEGGLVSVYVKDFLNALHREGFKVEVLDQ